GFLDWLEDRASGTGEIRGTWAAPEVAGDVTVISALYDRPIDLTDLLPWFRERVAKRLPRPGEKAIALDLQVHADDGLYVDNNFAKAEFQCDIHVGGTDISPRLGGRVDLLDGEVVFRDGRFTVT